MKAKWENEKQAIGKVQKLREEIENVNSEIEKAERNYELNKLAELKYGKLPELQKQLEEEEEVTEKSKEDGLLRNKVTEDEITKIVSRWTGIPVTKLMEGEREKILNLDKILHKRVIGQDEAVEKVTEAFKFGLIPETVTVISLKASRTVASSKSFTSSVVNFSDLILYPFSSSQSSSIFTVTSILSPFDNFPLFETLKSILLAICEARFSSSIAFSSLTLSIETSAVA